ncbi:MAG: NAD(P)-dependent oxidoreductase [Candidatus Shapirobacteria bacterium]|nr:NAD(P)-dependent oxidoreductase [Candidatus Shapirobacteria bacterium]
MKSKNISVLFPQSQFSPLQLERLANLGKVSFIKNTSFNSLIQCPKNTEILVFDPSIVGGVAKAKNKLWQILESLPNIKYLVLPNSDYSFVDLEYCRQKNIIISDVPFYDVESKAEHIISLLLGCTRKIFINDRRTYRRKNNPELGHNFKDITLGVIGINHLGEKVVELAKIFGCAVNFYDEKTVRIEGACRQTLDTLLSDSDMIVLCLSKVEENKKFLSKEKIKKLKEGSMVVNIGDRDWVDEKAMNEALVNRKVDTYCFEGVSLINSPLKENEFAVMFKPFSTYTKETIEKNMEAMVINIEGIVRGLHFNSVELYR